MGRRRTSGAALVAIAAALAIAGPAPGLAQSGNTPNWPELLPANPGNSAGTVSPGFDACPTGAGECPAQVILEMYERWRPLNRDCDHRAVFALTYLRTTEEFARTVQNDPYFFDDVPWVNHEDVVFAELYFRAYDAHLAGAPIPGAWTEAFQAAASPDVTGIGDVLLGMNAHIARDLPHALAAVGLIAPGGGSRKLDHDRVNFFLERVAGPLLVELGDRYDPLFDTIGSPGSPYNLEAVLFGIRLLREGAWRGAESLVNAASEAERQQAAAAIESQSSSQAATFRAANTMPGYGPTRDAWCRARNRPSFRVEIKQGERKLARLVRRGKLVLSVYADGPARFTLQARTGGAAGPAAARKRRKRGGLKLTRARQVFFDREGTQIVKLRLTKKARKRLAKRKRVRVQVLLSAPRGMEARAAKRLRRSKRARRSR